MVWLAALQGNFLKAWDAWATRTRPSPTVTDLLEFSKVILIFFIYAKATSEEARD